MRRLWLIFSQAVTVAVAALFVIATFKPHWLGSNPQGDLTGAVISMQTAPPAAAGASAPEPAPGSLAAAARIAMPAVVSVAANPGAPQRRPGGPWNPFDANPSHEADYGSGVIVSPDGILLTNHHVVQGARDIEIILADGRSMAAEVVGADPDTDLAVLRVKAEGLPALTLGHSSALQVGDAVLAIGNPFNFGQSVTSGIVSAVGRHGLGVSTFESFIQTDAAINPGNSGGALVDARGRLVGINTAIYTGGGREAAKGNIGIGFAIPVDLARQVMEGLLRDGEVQRGWIGVEPRALSPDFIESFQLPVSRGVLITGVLQDGPAHRAGIKAGDVVVRIDTTPVSSVPELLNTVAALKPGASATLAIQRGAQSMALDVTVAKRPPGGLPQRQR